MQIKQDGFNYVTEMILMTTVRVVQEESAHCQDLEKLINTEISVITTAELNYDG
jgi:hypothetical protein